MASTLILGLLGLVLIHAYAYRVFIREPRRLRSKLQRQGIEGPPPDASASVMAKMASTLILALLWLILIHAHRVIIWGMRRLRSKLGIEGPPPSHLLGYIPFIKKIRADEPQRARESRKSGGISHDWPSLLFPNLQKWRTQYGPIFMYPAGHIQFLLMITDVEMVKELSMCKSPSLTKPSYLSKDRGALLVQDILSSSGSTWASQRKIIARELYLDKVKVIALLSVLTDGPWIKRNGRCT